MNRVSVNITAQNQYSSALRIAKSAVVLVDDTGSMSMTAKLQCSLDGTTWFDTGNTWTAAAYYALTNGANLYWRVGVATGAFTSGTATLHLIESLM